jgi:flagellar biosynthesis protein FlhG
LRRIVQGETRRPRTIAVTSGKGGVGKTSLSVNLAICLAAKQTKVTLLDADFGLANADVLLNLPSAGNLSHVLSGRCELVDVMIDAPGGFRFVPGASGLARMANLSTFEQHRMLELLRDIERGADLLVLDCGAGISRNVTTFAAAADVCLVVTTPEPTAMTDAYATIKVIAQENRHARVGLVVNLCGSKGEARRTYERVSTVAVRFLEFAVGDFGYILSDEHVGLAVRQRMPLVLRYPRSSSATCIAAIAARLARDMEKEQGPRSFLQRVASMFF